MSAEHIRSSWQSRRGEYTTKIGWYNGFEGRGPDQSDNLVTDHCPSIMAAQRLSVASGTSGKPW